MLAAQFEEQSPADARLINKAVHSAWVSGMLRPSTIQVSAYEDDERAITDIPVLDISLADKVTGSKRNRVIELIHRSMARPVVLLVSMPDGTEILSLALTHVSRTDPTRSSSVIEEHLIVPTDQIAPGSLHLERLDRSNMWALYRDLARTAAADGHPASAALQADAAIGLRRQLTELEAEMVKLLREAGQAKNTQHRIDLRIQSKQTRAKIDRVRGLLYRPDHNDDRP
ncbi:Methyl-accepting chemotaxis protein [Nocardiopsis sp. JB363]|nr:Methyl-accepting chemotaxis protein [Nocardiopsis sp. JB363]